MSDLLTAVAAPKFGWFYKWTSLGSDGMPDRTIEDGLKQPDRIKISFTANSKEYSVSIVPDQARFGPEFFLAIRSQISSTRWSIASLQIKKRTDRPFSLF